MKFTKDKQSAAPPTTEEKTADVERLRGELAACERVIATFQPEECALLGRVDNLRQGQDTLARRLNEAQVCDRPTRDIALRLRAATEELPRLQNRLDEITPQLNAAKERAGEINTALQAAMRGNVERALRMAAPGCQSREACASAVGKLAELQIKLQSAESEVERIRESAVQRSECEGKALALLKTGSIPPRDESPRVSEAMRTATENVEVVKKAVQLQKSILDQLSADYANELTAALSAERTSLVQRIAKGLTEATSATLEAAMLRDAFSREIPMRSLPPFTFHGIQAQYPEQGQNDPFSVWLTQMRRDGHEV